MGDKRGRGGLLVGSRVVAVLSRATLNSIGRELTTTTVVVVAAIVVSIVSIVAVSVVAIVVVVTATVVAIVVAISLATLQGAVERRTANLGSIGNHGRAHEGSEDSFDLHVGCGESSKKRLNRLDGCVKEGGIYNRMVPDR